MTSLFISYSRKDIEVARKLTEAFKGHDLDFWIDWEGIPPTVDWWKEIQSGIEKANIFIFLISPDSAVSKVCKQEIEHAAKNGKRLIPLVVRDIKADESPTELRPLNWIFIRDNDNFDSGFGKLITAIKTDYEWVQAHSQIQIKALEWKRNNHENGFLLHGKELQDAENQLVANSSKQPYATDLQREYVLKSRQATDRQRRTTTSVAIVGLIIVAALAVFGFVQAGLATERENIAQTAQANAEIEADQRATAQVIAEENQRLAEEREKIARAGELATQSALLRDSDFRASLLLGIEAWKTYENARTFGTLLENTQTNPHLQTYLNRNKDSLLGLAFSPDGKILATSARDQTIHLWDMTTGQPLGQPLSGHASPAVNLAFSHNGRLLASVGYDRDLIFWDLQTQKPIGELMWAHYDYVFSLAFSPDDKILASTSMDQTIILWDVETHQPLGEPLEGHRNWVNSAAFSPDGEVLATASQDHTIILWDVETRQPIGEPLSGHSYWVHSVAFSPDGKTLASGACAIAAIDIIHCNQGEIIFWNVERRQQIGQPLTGHADYATSIVFSPDGKTLASVGCGKTDTNFNCVAGEIILWELQLFQTVSQSLRGHPNAVESIVFSPDGKTLASGSLDNTVILWDIKSLLPIGQTWNVDRGAVNSVAISPDGRTLASANYDRSITLWDVEKQRPIDQPLNRHSGQVESVAISPDGKTIASSGCTQSDVLSCTEGEIILWDMATRRPIGSPLHAHANEVSSVVFSPNGNILASGSWDGTIILWDMETKRPIGEPLIGDGEGVWTVAFSSDGKTLASGGEDNAVTLWNVETRQPIGQPLRGNTDIIASIAFSPDGKILASGSWDKTIILWDMETLQPIGQPLSGHSDRLYSVAFSPDGRTLASGAVDEVVILWDVETRQPIGQPLIGHEYTVTSVVFSPNGKMLASGSTEASVILWNLDPVFLLKKTCERAGRNFTRAEWEKYFPDAEYAKTCDQWPLDPEPVAIPNLTP